MQHPGAAAAVEQSRSSAVNLLRARWAAVHPMAQDQVATAAEATGSSDCRNRSLGQLRSYAEAQPSAMGAITDLLKLLLALSAKTIQVVGSSTAAGGVIAFQAVCEGLKGELLQQALDFEPCWSSSSMGPQPSSGSPERARQMGLVLKRSCMRMGRDAIIFTTHEASGIASAALLSQSYLEGRVPGASLEDPAAPAAEGAAEGARGPVGPIAAEDVVAMLMWKKDPNGAFTRLLPLNDLIWQRYLELLSRHSMFKSEEILLAQLAKLNDSSMMVITYHLHEPLEYEIDMESQDIIIKEQEAGSTAAAAAAGEPGPASSFCSLRQHLQLLVLEPQCDMICLDKPVDFQDPRQLITRSRAEYGPYSLLPESAGEGAATATFWLGYSQEAQSGSPQLQGIHLYHSNILVGVCTMEELAALGTGTSPGLSEGLPVCSSTASQQELQGVDQLVGVAVLQGVNPPGQEDGKPMALALYKKFQDLACEVAAAHVQRYPPPCPPQPLPAAPAAGVGPEGAAAGAEAVGLPSGTMVAAVGGGAATILSAFTEAAAAAGEGAAGAFTAAAEGQQQQQQRRRKRARARGSSMDEEGSWEAGGETETSSDGLTGHISSDGGAGSQGRRVRQRAVGQATSVGGPSHAAAGTGAVSGLGSLRHALSGGGFKCWMAKCRSVLQKLQQHKHAWAFNVKVDTVNWKCPDYYDIILQPMWFQLIDSKLQADAPGSYTSPMQFAEDVQQVFANAFTYNKPDTEVYGWAAELKALFEKRWAEALPSMGPDAFLAALRGTTPAGAAAAATSQQTISAPALGQPSLNGAAAWAGGTEVSLSQGPAPQAAAAAAAAAMAAGASAAAERIERLEGIVKHYQEMFEVAQRSHKEELDKAKGDAAKKLARADNEKELLQEENALLHGKVKALTEELARHKYLLKKIEETELEEGDD